VIRLYEARVEEAHDSEALLGSELITASPVADLQSQSAT